MLAQVGNAEVLDYSMALMGAREAAMERLQEDLEAEHQGPDAAEGVVGVQVEERVERSVSNPMPFNLVEYTAVGTAIAPLHPRDPSRAPAATTPTVVVPLDR